VRSLSAHEPGLVFQGGVRGPAAAALQGAGREKRERTQGFSRHGPGGRRKSCGHAAEVHRQNRAPFCWPRCRTRRKRDLRLRSDPPCRRRFLSAAHISGQQKSPLE